MLWRLACPSPFFICFSRTLVNLVEHPRTWNFFQGLSDSYRIFTHRRTNGDAAGKGQLTTEQFPFDLDTTSLGLTVLRREKELASSVMDEMLEYVDTDGIIQV
jgi:hypothetical protein